MSIYTELDLAKASEHQDSPGLEPAAQSEEQSYLSIVVDWPEVRENHVTGKNAPKMTDFFLSEIKFFIL
jgi:hypothetical protein